MSGCMRFRLVCTKINVHINRWLVLFSEKLSQCFQKQTIPSLRSILKQQMGIGLVLDRVRTATQSCHVDYTYVQRVGHSHKGQYGYLGLWLGPQIVSTLISGMTTWPNFLVAGDLVTLEENKTGHVDNIFECTYYIVLEQHCKPHPSLW